MDNWLGYEWLARRYKITPVQRFRVESRIAKSRSTVHTDGYVTEYHTPATRPAPTLTGHLTFALKREGIHLEFLARLFDVIPQQELEAWIASEPTGQYARRAGFFYELLTDRTLDFSGVTAGNYVSALDEERYLTATKSRNNTRWRVRDNLPGTRHYCPIVLRSPVVQQAEKYSCEQHLSDLETEFGAELLLRSVVWLTIKESRASFAIEHEQHHTDRIRRFAAVMEHQCGRSEAPLTVEALTDLQTRILGPRAMRYGLRLSPVFVGETDGFDEVVHYIGPHWDAIPSMLSGLASFDERTDGASSIARAAVMSFGFVYIHPMADGNGRISRFLINDILRRDNAVPAPFILPVSATITSTVLNRQGYDQVLELFSRPFMRKYAESWHFGPEQVAPDGVRYNLHFGAYDDALAAWRYPDLTEHVEYLTQVIRLTIEQEMHKEAYTLRNFRLARERVKQVIEGPDADIDRVVRSVRETGGTLSNKLRKEFPLLQNEAIAKEIIDAVQSTFSGHSGVSSK